MNKVYSFVLMFSFFIFGFISLPSVYAKPPFKDVPPKMPTPTAIATVTPQPRVMNQRQVRLSGTALAVCQSQEQVINTRMTNLTRYAVTMLETFDKISKRVTDYYTTTVLPSGKTVEQYDDLVKTIQDTRAVSEADLKTAQSDSESFSCTGINPKGHMTLFRTDMQEVKKSLKEYRTAIKDLIVAVHSVVSPTETPTPTGN